MDQECGGIFGFLLLSAQIFSLFLSLEEEMSKGPVVLSAIRKEVPRMIQQISLLPSTSSILSLRLASFPPEKRRRAQHAAARATKSSSPLRGGNSVGGKVIRLLATKSFPADSCFIILRPTSTYAGPHSALVLCLFLSFSLSAPPLVPSFHSPSVSTSDRCVTHPGKIAMDARARAGHAGDVVAN